MAFAPHLGRAGTQPQIGGTFSRFQSAKLPKEITTALRIRLSVVEEPKKRMAKSSTTDPEAYRDYLKGRYSWNKSNEEGSEQGHRRFFRRAIAKDPNYASKAYSGMADTYSFLNGNYFLPPIEVLPKAKEAAREGSGISTIRPPRPTPRWVTIKYCE